MRLLILALALLAVSDPAAARCLRDELWELTTQALDPGLEDIAIPVLSPGRSKALWLRSEGGPVAVTVLRVEFEDGGAFSPGTALIARDRIWSDPLSFPADEARVVTRVTLRYKSLRGGAERVSLQIWGQQTVPAKC